MTEKIGYTLTIPHKHIEDTYSIRGELHAQHGITFDTGAGSDGLDWFIDWSLRSNDNINTKEAISIIKKKLDEAGVTYDVTIEPYEAEEI
jgi:hypothetical protein